MAQSKSLRLLASATLLFASVSLFAQSPEPDPTLDPEVSTEESPEAKESNLTESQVDGIQTDVSTNEDPDAQRRLNREAEEERDPLGLEWDFYGSVRVHAINAFNQEEPGTEANLGDGASRVGATLDWHFRHGWNLFSRLESGFDVLDTFTPKAQNEDGGIFTPRLYNAGLESDWLYAKYGKSWSVYYKVAGAADRFSIFGGNAAGIYNAGTDGGHTGTGRADNALQTQVYLDMKHFETIRPFNVNLQFQGGEPIPQIESRNYQKVWSASAWQETNAGVGIGLAYHRASIADASEGTDSVLTAAGIDGDAKAVALAFKTSGERWFASLVLTSLDNIETTDQFLYFNGSGAELFAQWQFHERWWVVGGGNWLKPDEESTQAGKYEVAYGVIGLRFTFDSQNRMAYAEYKFDNGFLADGTPREDEFTMGIRWDFGY